MAVKFAMGRRFLVLTTSAFNMRLLIRRDIIEQLEETDDGTWVNGQGVVESVDEILAALESDI